MEESLSIGIIQPSSAPDLELFERGLEVLRQWKIPFKSFVDFEEARPSHKAFLLYELMTSSRFTHLWAVRGGAGAVKLLPYLDELLSSEVTPLNYLPQLVGFSDITTLHLYFWKRFKRIGLHAPMIVNLPELDKRCLKILGDLLIEGSKGYKITGRSYRGGVAEGVLIGGNLSIVASLCGTPYFPEEKEILLFLEETNERLYRLERAFLQIILSLPEGSLKGIVLGDLGKVRAEDFLKGVEEFIPQDVPIAYAFPFGHIPKNVPLPIGGKASLKVSRIQATLQITG
jgi:muramoyltetrapeptide carboxypeptidase